MTIDLAAAPLVPRFRIATKLALDACVCRSVELGSWLTAVASLLLNPDSEEDTQTLVRTSLLVIMTTDGRLLPGSLSASLQPMHCSADVLVWLAIAKLASDVELQAWQQWCDWLDELHELTR